MKPIPIFIVIGFLMLHVEIIAEDEVDNPPANVLTREVRVTDSPELSRISRFQGSLESLRWKLLGLDGEPVDLALDVYQLAAKTAVPLVKSEVIAEGLLGMDENTVEVSLAWADRDFGDRAASFLIRLWSKRENENRLIDAVILKLEAPGILEKLGDLTIHFDGDSVEREWLATLRASGVKMVPHRTEALGERDARNSLLIIEVGEDIEIGYERTLWKRVIRLDASIDPAEVKAVANESGGWVLTIHPEWLDTLRWDPESQRRFVDWIREGAVPVGKEEIDTNPGTK